MRLRPPRSASHFLPPAGEEARSFHRRVKCPGFFFLFTKRKERRIERNFEKKIIAKSAERDLFAQMFPGFISQRCSGFVITCELCRQRSSNLLHDEFLMAVCCGEEPFQATQRRQVDSFICSEKTKKLNFSCNCKTIPKEPATG